jgi:hypothetical protein
MILACEESGVGTQTASRREPRRKWGLSHDDTVADASSCWAVLILAAGPMTWVTLSLHRGHAWWLLFTSLMNVRQQAGVKPNAGQGGVLAVTHPDATVVERATSTQFPFAAL